MNFPASPQTGDLYTLGNKTWTWTGVAWKIKPNALIASDIPDLDAAKVSSGIFDAARIPGLTGDVTKSAGSSATTLATVNSNVGTFGSASQTVSLTVNAKGLVTAVTTNAVAAPTFSSITGKPTTLSGYGITDAQPLDSTLSSLANLTGSGVIIATGTDVFTMRSIGTANAIDLLDRQSGDGRYLGFGGGTLTGALTLSADPTSALHAATKQYVDNAVQGLDAKPSVRAATTGDIILAGVQNIDGVTIVSGDRILVRAQSNAAQNGIYTVGGGAWSRSADMNDWLEVPASYVFVESGSMADTGWVCTNDPGGTLGTTAISWVQFSGAASLTASNGITKVGSDLQLTGQALALHNYATNGFLVRTGSGTFASRALAVPAAGLTITNADGVSGNPTLALSNDLAAIEAMTATGIVRRTATDTWTASALSSVEITTALGYTPFHAGNDGAASGLDSDLLDGQHGAYYLDLANATGTLANGRLTADVVLRTVANTFAGKVTAPSIAVVAPSYNALSVTSAGLDLVGDVLNTTTARYGPALKFLNTDADWTTTNPRLMAYVAPYADQNASSDTTGSTGLEFGVTPANPGTSSLPSVALTLRPDRVAVFTAAPLYNANAILHAGSMGAGSLIDSDFLDGQQGAFYQSATNQITGTLPSARLSGAYTGITGIGTLVNDFLVQKNNAWLTLRTSNTGDEIAQAGGISIGRSGYKGANALHITYTGDGNGHIGLGVVDPDTSIPENWAMQMNYMSNSVTFASVPNVMGADVLTTATLDVSTKATLGTNVSFASVTATATTPVALATNGQGSLIGSIGSYNVISDPTSIQARLNGASSSLFLNPLGGSVYVGGISPSDVVLTGQSNLAATKLTGTVPNANLSGTYDGINIRMTSANNLYSVSPTSTGFTSSDMVQFRTAGTTGAIVFVAPSSATSIMHQLHVRALDYGVGIIDFIVQGYRPTAAWTSTALNHHGNVRPMVRLATNAAGRNCLIIGDVGTVWPQLHLSIIHAMFSHTGATESYCMGWTATATTSLTGYANISADLSASDSSYASEAAHWTTGRTIALTGDVTGTSVAFDGQSNLSFATTLSAASVLAKLLTVDGASSALDADLLDGQHGAFYQSASNINAGTLADTYLPATMTGKTFTTALTMAPDVWQSGGGAERLMFSNAASTYYKSPTSHVFRNGSNIDVVTITSTGSLTSANTITATSFIGSGAALTGLTATNLSGIIPAANLPAFTGDVTSPSGSAVQTLATVNSNTGAFGSATQVGSFTVNAKGLITAASAVTITPAFSSITGKPTTLAGYGITDASASTHTHTFASLTAKPTTLSGYGITDAQGLNTNLTSLSGLDAAVGLVYHDGASGFTKRPIGAAAGNIIDRLAGETLFLGVANTAVNSALFNGQNAAYYSNAANLTGVLSSARLPASTGDVTSPAGSSAMTLATVNANVGAFGSATAAPTFTVNAKGLITAAGTVTITPAWGSVTSKPTTIAGYGITDLLSSIVAIDGVASGIDSDLLDGQQGSYYQNSSNQNAGTLPAARLPASTGDVTAPAGSSAFTLASVNANTGTFGSATTSVTLTVNAKGLITAASAATITPSFWSVTDRPTTLAGYGITDAPSRANIGVGAEASITATDVRNVTNPALGIGYMKGMRVRFSAMNDDSTGPWADVIDLSTYGDLNGGGINALYFNKNYQGIVHKWSNAGETTWTSRTVAYTDSALSGSTTGSAATLTTGRTIAMTGDVSWTSPAFNGSGNVTAAGTLATVNGNVGLYGSATQVPTIVVNAKGLVTAVGLATVTPDWSSITSKPTTLAGYGITNGAALTGSTFTGTNFFVAGTTTTAPFAFQAGTTMTSPVAHAVEWNGTNLFVTTSAAARKTVAFTDSALSGSTTGSAATLTTGRTIAMTGDVAWTSPSFNGSANVTAAGTLATVNSNVGAFGSATAVSTFTVDAKGRTTAAGSVAINVPSALGYTPVQQGTGVGQLASNVVKIGWSGSRVKITVDTSDIGNVAMEGVSNTYSGVNTFNGGLVAAAGLQVYNGNAQFPEMIRINPTGHATSRRATLVMDNWSFNQDTNGDGVKNFGFYSGALAQFAYTIGTDGKMFLTNGFSHRPTFAGATPWDSGNFSPQYYALLASPTFTGTVTTGPINTGAITAGSLTINTGLFYADGNHTIVKTGATGAEKYWRFDSNGWLYCLTGGVIASGDVRAAGVVSHSAGGVHLRQKDNSGAGGRAFLHYKDSTNYYMLLTANDDADGTFNGLRPFTLNLSSGLVSIGHGLNVSGAVATTGTITATGNISSSGGDISCSGNVIIGGSNLQIGASNNAVSTLLNRGTLELRHSDGPYIDLTRDGTTDRHARIRSSTDGNLYIDNASGVVISAENGGLVYANGGSGKQGGELLTNAGTEQIVYKGIAYNSTDGFGASHSSFLEARGNGGTGVDSSATMRFHRPGAYGVNFGLGWDNQLRVGGWSAGNVSQVVWTGFNFDPASKVNLSAVDVNWSNATVPQRNAAGALNAVNFQTSAVAGNGLRLWNGDQSYSIYMADEGNSTWGGRPSNSISYDYNMYFRMTGDGRGWVFYNGSAKAKIDGNGNATFNRVATNEWFYTYGGGGLFDSSSGQGIRATSSSGHPYGTMSVYGNGTNGWQGLAMRNDGVLTWMCNTDNVGLHHSSNSWLINGDVAGNFTFRGNVTAYSDLRLKDVLGPITDAKLRRDNLAEAAIIYRRTDGDNERVRVGYGAQTLRAGGNAELVHEADDAMKLATGLGTLSVDYGESAAILAVASKETDDRVAALTTEVDDLKSQVAALTALVNRLLGE